MAKDKAAQQLVRKRWDATSEEERADVGRQMAEARWAGHDAKRPASSRKKKTAG